MNASVKTEYQILHMTGVTVHMQVRSFYIASANYLGKMVGRRPLDELFLYGVDMYRL